ncbi:DegT/DnrJ/EryC1/StrS family aminotransferase [Aliarcobacter cryaerophilus]|uniref:DegT/DnrJ/EryC1/StrS family aminotransferase n=1 Tax=Aliarcobacter cryaerophilus TaxID=28198 RepID=UPI0021B615EF|nr:DegT/DnrJ/EryC1/StrS family aminotransferase [Aliarcobacter cryaerophilus]MCT7492513.1 DegT/DnrJ/EryC1/StrS family aminotransferase [Aliarcobacter cryaerophilus]
MIPHSKPFLDNKELEKIIEVYKGGNIAVGKEIEEFERKVADYIGKKYAIATSSGTTALHLLLYSMGIQKNDEVILPASVCPGVMHAIEYTSATPVICDINEKDFNISVEHTKKLITKNTKAILVPHMFGLPSDIDELLLLNIPIIEDCAQSIGADYKDNKVGSFGYASIFSFYATKMFTSIDGGMILTDDEKLAEKLKDLRYYGGKKDYKLRFNYKIQNINAAVGLVQFEKLESFLIERNSLASKYFDIFNNVKWIEILNQSTDKKVSSNYRFIIKVDQEKREFFENICKKYEIVLGDTIFEDLSLFASQYFKESLSNTQNLIKSTYSFPLYPNIDDNGLKEFFEELLS